MEHIFKNDAAISLFFMIFFIIFSVFLPIYDATNGLHNVIFDNYKLVWYDGRSPANVHLILNLVQNASVSFPKGYSIDGSKIENNFDFKEIGGRYYPRFTLWPVIIVFLIVKIIPFSTELQLFKILLLVNMLLSSAIIGIFYMLQRLLGLRRYYSSISTLVVSISSSMLIYARYLFFTETISTLVFILLIYIVVKNWSKQSRKNDIIIFSLLSLFLILLNPDNILLQIILSLIFAYFLFKYKSVKSIYIFTLILIISVVVIKIYATLIYPIVEWRTAPMVTFIKNFIGNSSYNIFPRYINALDYSIFGYSNSTSEWKHQRQFAYIYGFAEEKGNAIFIFSYSLPGALFGPKGFVYNSPFLIFSILGLFIYIHKEKRDFLLALIILFIVIFGLRFFWYGGVTPRYIRGFNIPILLLSFFSFYFIQENKNIFIRLVFVLLVIVSTLNVISLAIRADWTYEHEADLVSYDLVLWPLIPTEQKTMATNTLEFNLASRTEQARWSFSGDPGCNAKPENGIKTDPCYCTYSSWAQKTVAVPWDYIRLNTTVCADIAGNDGTEGTIYLNGKLLDTIFVSSYSCVSKSYVQKLADHSVEIKLKSGQYGKCSGDMTFWKYISVEEYRS